VPNVTSVGSKFVLLISLIRSRYFFVFGVSGFL